MRLGFEGCLLISQVLPQPSPFCSGRMRCGLMRSHPLPLPQQRLIALPCKNAAVLFISLSFSAFLPWLKYIQSNFSVFTNPFVRPIVTWLQLLHHDKVCYSFMKRKHLPRFLVIFFMTRLFYFLHLFLT